MKNKNGSIIIQLTAKQLILLISGIFAITVLSFFVAQKLIKNDSGKKKGEKKRQVVKNKTPGNRKIIKPAGAPQKKLAPPIKKNVGVKKRLPPVRKPEKEHLTFYESVKDKKKKVRKPKKETSVYIPKKFQERKTDGKTKSYTIQVVSYRSELPAKKLKDTLKQKGYEAYTTKVDIANKGIYYRVLVGSFSNKKRAQRVFDLLVTQEIKNLKLGKPVIRVKN